MARITKFVKGIQNHWKKSLFGVAAITYGINTANERYKINQLMRHYCSEASIYGDKTHPAHQPFEKIIVILNPMADKKSAVDTFEKYCAPILHLGGLYIEIVKTDSEGHARRYVEELETLPHAILCAGGDGTLSEIVTGLFRRSSKKNEAQPVLGILPVGRENTFGQKLFNFTKSSDLQHVEGLADASLSIVRGNVAPKDVMKIELIDEEFKDKVKPVYALSSLEWGAFIDAFNDRDRYWYFGSLRDYVTFIFNAFNDSLTWNCAAVINYTQPCAGCNNCYVEQNQFDGKTGNRRWWTAFIPSFRLGSQSSSKSPDYSNVYNANCAIQTSTEINSVGVIVNTSNIENQKADETIPHLSLKLIKGKDGFSFISDSFNRINKQHIDLEQNIPIRSIEIWPKLSTIPDQNRFFYIDHESYEVKPIRITLLSKLIKFYST